MANPQLIQYISDNTKAGFTRADIEKALVAAGWGVGDISAAFAGSVVSPTVTPAAPAVITPVQPVVMPAVQPIAQPAVQPIVQPVVQAQPQPVVQFEQPLGVQTMPQQVVPPVQPQPVVTPAVVPATGADFMAEMARRRGTDATNSNSAIPGASVTPNYTPPQLQKFSPVSNGAAEAGITGFMIKNGIAKTTQQANMILMGVVAVIIIIIIWLNLPGSSPAPAVVPQAAAATPQTNL